MTSERFLVGAESKDLSFRAHAKRPGPLLGVGPLLASPSLSACAESSREHRPADSARQEVQTLQRAGLPGGFDTERAVSQHPAADGAAQRQVGDLREGHDVNASGSFRASSIMTVFRLVTMLLMFVGCMPKCGVPTG